MNKILKSLKKVNDWAAFKLAAIYGAAITIWIFAVYSLLGALVSNETQNHMLYWSNAAQLVFCPLMVYVGNQINKSHKENSKQIKANHEEVIKHIKRVHSSLGIEDK